MRNALVIAGLVIKELCRRKDFYVLFILIALVTLTLGSINIFNDDRITRYVKEICLLLIWISTLVMAITTTARQIPAERENRTIFPLLAKPVSRWELILGKFLGCWLALGLSLLIFYLLFTVINSSREHHWPILHYAQAMVLHWVMLGIVIALTLLGSVTLTTTAANATICLIISLGILLLGRHLNKVAQRLAEPAQTILEAAYFTVPHLEFFDLRDLITHGDQIVPWTFWLLAILYGMAYTALFLAAAWAIFRRKSLN